MDMTDRIRKLRADRVGTSGDRASIAAKTFERLEQVTKGQEQRDRLGIGTYNERHGRITR